MGCSAGQQERKQRSYDGESEVSAGNWAQLYWCACKPSSVVARLHGMCARGLCVCVGGGGVKL